MRDYRKKMLIAVMMVFSVTACDRTFQGKVIDADTKQPIEGAVVVAKWSEEQKNFSGGTQRFKDIAEHLTDKNGEWKIKGPRGRKVVWIPAIFSLVTGAYITTPPEIIVFKPGYCSWPQGFGIDACKGIKPGGTYQVADGKTVELPKLTNREDRRKNSAISLPDDKKMQKKVMNFIRLLDEEDEYLYPGLQKKSMYKELLEEFSNEK